jgi:hypothetical protein
MIPMSSTAVDVSQGLMGMLVPDWVQTEYRNWKKDLPHIMEEILSLAQYQGIAHLFHEAYATDLFPNKVLHMVKAGTKQCKDITLAEYEE